MLAQKYVIMGFVDTFGSTFFCYFPNPDGISLMYKGQFFFFQTANLAQRFLFIMLFVNYKLPCSRWPAIMSRPTLMSLLRISIFCRIGST